MASFDLDPIFLKGLRLLHSKAKDSADQLRQLLEDVLAKHNPSLPAITSREKGFLSTNRLENESKNSGSKKSSPRHSNESSSQSSSKSSLSDEPKKKEAEKRHFEKLNQELSELFNYDSGVKRPRLLGESPRSSLSSSPSPQPTTIKIEEQASSTTTVKSEFMDSIAMLAATASGGPTDAEDFALEMGLVCIVCKQLEVTSRNQLIECQECHSLYHQECHRPSVTDTEVNDPRHVWYCIRCTKNMRKASKSQKTSVKSSNVSVNMRETVISSKVPKTVELPSPSTPSLLPFKRSELKTSGASQSSGMSHGTSAVASSNKPTGLASLAANFSNRAPATTLSTTSSTNKTGFGTKGGLSSLATSKLTSSFPSIAGSPTTSKGGKPSPSALISLANAVSSKSVTVPTRSLSTTNAPVNVNSNNAGNGGNSGKSSTSSSLMSADKRLQIMKKKAAQKMQEKRRLSSK